MLYDKWENFLNYSALMPEAARAVMKFAGTADAALGNGSYDSGVKGVGISVFDSKTTADYKDAVWEIHKDYADIQTLLAGREINFCRSPEGLTPKMEYDARADYQLFHPEKGDDLQLTLLPGYFAIYLPGEAHITSFTADGASQPVKKIVFKVHKSLFRK